MIWQAKQISKHFPELVDIPLKQQQEIVEIARHQAYMKEGGRKKFVRPYIYSALAGLISIVIVITMIQHFIPFKPFLFIMIGGGFTVVFAMIQMQQHWIKQMRPKVQELAERYRSGDE